ncbi:MAG: alanine--tRNA ligase [Rickettsiaceae bacterium]
MSTNTISQIRNKFIEYFTQNQHVHVKSSSLIPHNDPSLMFVNSGMVQFKNVFTDQERREYVKATSSQKCLRAGGKHNDLENVGYTARHHTFFEMLGNFSFGDYFKEEAIYHAWNLLTKDLELSKDKLYITIYHSDQEAAQYWKKIANLSDDRIIRIKTSDNFWSMGPTGPCGPCSEIFYDHGPSIAGGPPGSPNEDGDRFVEIWNLVFMEFEQIDEKTRVLLPKKSVDTGMGLERIATVLQGIHDNYDTDLFKELITTSEDVIKVKNIGQAQFSYRIITDHLRAMSFLIADGIMPSNEGRGYVLRRIMRRAMRHAHTLGARNPVIYKILPKLVELMGSFYLELDKSYEFIQSIIHQEEERFIKTLGRGMKLLTEEIENKLVSKQLTGEAAFKLYDTYGFPLDLTQDILKEKNITVDTDGFDKEMKAQKDRARKAWSGSGEGKIDQTWFDIKSKYGSTEFLGYTLNKAYGKVLELIHKNKQIKNFGILDVEFIVIVNQTPFYAESGGQMGDIGAIKSDHCEIQVIDTKKYLGLHAHICKLKKGSINTNDTIYLEINDQYRQNLKLHHSATHLLHSALRQKLGAHVTQKGSLVAQNYLRFDFSNPSAITNDQLLMIENDINQIIRNNLKLNTQIMSIDDAIDKGAMALFGEKYDNEVRVVSVGDEKYDNLYSIELCGGTHINNTGEIGLFKIVGEQAIAAGVRRIEGVCGQFALDFTRNYQDTINQISQTLKVPNNDILSKISYLIDHSKSLEQALVNASLSKLDLSTDEINKTATKIKDISFVFKIIDSIDDIKLIRNAAIASAGKTDNLIILYAVNLKGKISIIVATSQSLKDKFSAKDFVNNISLFLDGKGGGGTATLAQAGGTNIKKLYELQHYAIDNLTNML